MIIKARIYEKIAKYLLLTLTDTEDFKDFSCKLYMTDDIYNT